MINQAFCLLVTPSGRTVYEGEGSYLSSESALQDMEAGITAYLDENGI